MLNAGTIVEPELEYPECRQRIKFDWVGLRFRE